MFFFFPFLSYFLLIFFLSLFLLIFFEVKCVVDRYNWQRPFQMATTVYETEICVAVEYLKVPNVFMLVADHSRDMYFLYHFLERDPCHS